jgi:hypothetical protein
MAVMYDPASIQGSLGGVAHLMREAIHCNQKSSAVISGHQW